jgi:ribosome-associated toxin RatA of RatAB toxin-antitoxin module
MNPREPVHRSYFVAGAEPREVYDVVVDFPAYPRLFPDLKESRVISAQPPLFRVEFRAQIVLPVRYVLELTCDPAVPSIDWTFVEGEIVADSTGGWRFTAQPGGTRIDYRAAIDVRAPLPGFVLRKVTDGLVAASLPRMFASIQDEVKRRQVARPAG